MSFLDFLFTKKNKALESGGLCDKKLSKKLVDLDKVTIETSLEKKVDSVDKSFKFNLYYKDKKMKRTKLLGEGDYGKVYLYSIENIELVIKITKPNISIDDDTSTVENYLPKKCKESVIPLRIIKDKYKNPFLIMQIADGDLKGIEVDEKLKFAILINLADSLDCLLKKGIIYTDLKLENILYKCIEDKLAIYLGDVGSLDKYGETFTNGFIVAPESRNNSFTANKAYLLYTFAVLILELYNYDIRDIKEFYKDKDIDKNIKTLVKSYSTKNPKNREKFNLSLTRDLLKN